MSSVDEPILITGAAGIVGRAVVAALMERNWRVLSIVRNISHTVLEKSIALDLSKIGDDLMNVISGRPQAVVHLAAAVPHSARYPDTHESAGMTQAIDMNVASAVQKWQCSVIYMSTCGIYERSLDCVKREDDETVVKLTSPYFEAKWKGEKLFGEIEGSTIFRVAAPVGPGLKRRVVLGRFLDIARNGGVISVWGTGGREQNFVDARDVAGAVLMALERRGAGVINLAAARPVTMLELAQTVVEVIGHGDIRLNEQDDPLEHETARYDIRRAGKVLGWHPKIGLRDSLNWIRGEPLTD